MLTQNEFLPLRLKREKRRRHRREEESNEERNREFELLMVKNRLVILLICVFWEVTFNFFFGHKTNLKNFSYSK